MFGCIYEHVCLKLYACVDIKPHIYEMKYFECVPPCAGAKSVEYFLAAPASTKPLMKSVFQTDKIYASFRNILLVFPNKEDPCYP